MSELTKKRVRWFEKNKETDEILHDEDVDILTSAEATLFNDGESLQEKYDNGNIARTSQLGDLNALSTTNNSNLVDAVNEVNASVSSNTKSIETLGEALDEINNELDNLSSDASEITYNDSTVANALNELNSEVDNVLTTAKSYTDTKVADLVGSAPQTLDTLQEVAQAIEENEDVVDALNSAIGNKANQSDLDAYLPKDNPVATGSFSMGRKEGSTVGKNSVAMGIDCMSGGDYSQAEGYKTIATGWYSKAEGQRTVAGGTCSHAEGYYTTANGLYQHAQGKFNIEDTEDAYAHIVGNGQDENNRSNAHTLDWGGNAWYAGDVTATDSNGNSVSVVGNATNISNLTNTVNALQSTVEHLGLPPRPVTDVVAKLYSYNDGTKELSASWTLAPIYDVQVANINIYGCTSEEVPTAFAQFEIITSVSSTSTSAFIQVDKLYNYVLIAPVSTNGIIQNDLSYMCDVIMYNLPAKGASFSSMTWNDIGIISDNGMASEYFAIGDTKTIDINGTSYDIAIYDFDHDDKADGSGKAGMTIGLVNCIKSYETMEGGVYSNTAWNNCYIRKTDLPAIYNKLPQELRNVIKSVSKVSRVASTSVAASLETTIDTLFLFSDDEIGINYNNSSSSEGSKYPIFTDASSRIKKKGDNGDTCTWWTRSTSTTSGYFVYVKTDGYMHIKAANTADGYMCFGFCI